MPMIFWIKLLLPEQTAHARQEVVELIDMDMDYRGLAVQVGKVLTDETAQQVYQRIREQAREVFGEGTVSDDLENEEFPCPTTMHTVTPAPTCTPRVFNIYTTGVAFFSAASKHLAILSQFALETPPSRTLKFCATI